TAARTDSLDELRRWTSHLTCRLGRTPWTCGASEAEDPPRASVCTFRGRGSVCARAEGSRGLTSSRAEILSGLFAGRPVDRLLPSSGVSVVREVQFWPSPREISDGGRMNLRGDQQGGLYDPAGCRSRSVSSPRLRLPGMSTDIVDESWTENEDGWGGERKKTWRKSQSSAESRQTWWRTNAAPHGRKAGDHQGSPRASGRGLGVDGVAGDDTSLLMQGREQRVTSTMNLCCDQQDVVYGPAVTGSRARSEQEADYSSRGKGQRRAGALVRPGRAATGASRRDATIKLPRCGRWRVRQGGKRSEGGPRRGHHRAADVGYDAVTIPGGRLPGRPPTRPGLRDESPSEDAGRPTPIGGKPGCAGLFRGRRTRRRDARPTDDNGRRTGWTREVRTGRRGRGGGSSANQGRIVLRASKSPIDRSPLDGGSTHAQRRSGTSGRVGSRWVRGGKPPVGGFAARGGRQGDPRRSNGHAGGALLNWNHRVAEEGAERPRSGPLPAL
ncbi:hypothetical protein THAOC_01402, partial [Thalassiosira oceanica]